MGFAVWGLGLQGFWAQIQAVPLDSSARASLLQVTSGLGFRLQGSRLVSQVFCLLGVGGKSASLNQEASSLIPAPPQKPPEAQNPEPEALKPKLETGGSASILAALWPLATATSTRSHEAEPPYGSMYRNSLGFRV